MECDGAPMTWLCDGPLMTRRIDQVMDQSRRLAGSNYEQAADIVERFHPKEVYVYAMGQEPWLNHIMSIKYTNESRPIAESNKLIAHCRERREWPLSDYTVKRKFSRLRRLRETAAGRVDLNFHARQRIPNRCGGFRRVDGQRGGVIAGDPANLQLGRRLPPRHFGTESPRAVLGEDQARAVLHRASGGGLTGCAYSKRREALPGSNRRSRN